MAEERRDRGRPAAEEDPLELSAAIIDLLEVISEAGFDDDPDLDTATAAREIREALTPLNPGTPYEQTWGYIAAAKRAAFLEHWANTDAEAGTGMTAQKAAVDRFDSAVARLDAAHPDWRGSRFSVILGQR